MSGAMGATVHMHYCMGKLVDTSLMHDDEHLCGKCGMKKSTQKKGCCKDEQKTFKTTDHQLAKENTTAPAVVCPDLLSSCGAAIGYSTRDESNIQLITYTDNPPELWRSCPIFILDRNFRI